MRLIQKNKKNIKEIVTALKNGAVLILPTDTIYGLVCDAVNDQSVKKIFKIKNRAKQKSLPIFVSGIKQAKKLASINKNQEAFLKENWPGAITAILEAKKGLSSLVYKNGTIGLRAPNYEFLSLILKEFKKPLAQTSANVSGLMATTKIKEVLEQFDQRDIQPDIVIDAGDLPKSQPSTIIDITGDKIKILRK